jgi:putative membrane protein
MCRRRVRESLVAKELPSMKILVGLVMLSFSAVSIAVMPAFTRSFIDRAAQGSMTEVKAGKLAMTKSRSPRIREFAEMVVRDHSDAQILLKAIAADKQMSLPTVPSPEQQDSLKELQTKDGAQFERAYVAAQVEAHQQSVALLKAEIARGQDAETKAFAKELLPAVESHLKEAFRLAGKDERTTALQKDRAPTLRMRK